MAILFVNVSESDLINFQAVKQFVEQQLQENMHWLYSQSTESTNDELMRLMQHNSVAITEYQTQGRGQHQRVWQAEPAKHLLFSLSLESVDSVPLGLYPIATGIAVCDTLNALTQQDIQLKWPNDLYIKHQKLGGILVEAKTIKNNILVVIGVGLNVYSSGQNELNKAFLNDLSLQTISRSELLQQLIVAIFSRLNNINPLQIVEQFNERHIFHNRVIQFKSQNQTFSGQCKGINDLGELILQLSSGKLMTFSQGSIVLE